MTFGATLRALRTERQLTQTDLAVKSALAISTIAHLEAGGRSPNLATVQQLARALGVGVEVFDNGKEKTQ